MRVKIYTDGGCSPNPGKGGWAWVKIVDEGGLVSSSGGVPHSTNNRMELQAVIQALSQTSSGEAIDLYTDSTYVLCAARAGWWQKLNPSVTNFDLWSALQLLINTRDIEWHWVKGHSGQEWNELCDELVKREIFSK